MAKDRSQPVKVPAPRDEPRGKRMPQAVEMDPGRKARFAAALGESFGKVLRAERLPVRAEENVIVGL